MDRSEQGNEIAVGRSRRSDGTSGYAAAAGLRRGLAIATTMPVAR